MSFDRARGQASRLQESLHHHGLGLVLIAFSAGGIILDAPEKPLHLPELGPETFAEAFPELAGDNLQFQDEQSFTVDITNTLACLDTMEGEDTISDVLDIFNSLTSTAFLDQPSDISDYGSDGDCPEDEMVAAMLEDTYPFLEVAMSPLLDPMGTQGGVGAQSPLLNSPAAPQHHPPSTAQLVEEALRTQPRVFLTRLPLPPATISRRVIHRSGKVGSKQAKCPAPDSTRRMRETSPWDNVPPKKRKKMVVCRWEEKMKGDSAAVGSSRKHGSRSKRRASNGSNIPTKRSRTLGDGQTASCHPSCC